ncbi:MAG: MoxR family ATPase [Planctomycetes bacterium]|nr:MoxR family ATPase [Planctomycetota bacterium]
MSDAASGAGAPASAPPGVADLGKVRDAYQRMKRELAQVIVGQESVIDELLIALFSRGHCLLVGVPGLAKTLLVSSVARVLDLSFKRIQFTPDLMPSDITGTEVIQENKSTGAREFRFLPGPIFANVLLADEINRTPPKTQSALLEAMQEYQVTAGGRKHQLDQPFFVLATQNPIEQEGTYPLPEAQLDRFMFLIQVDYPAFDEERRILRLTTEQSHVELQKVLTGQEILRIQELVRGVVVSNHAIDYALRLARATRVRGKDAGALPSVKEWLSWGAGPRASQFLVLGAKARAALQGRAHVEPADIAAVAHPVLRHRIVTNFHAEAEGITSDVIVDRLLKEIDPNKTEHLDHGGLPKVLGSSGAQ